MNLIPRLPWSETQVFDYFRVTMGDLSKHGLTSIHDAEAGERLVVKLHEIVFVYI
jgi:hypothetical protein